MSDEVSDLNGKEHQSSLTIPGYGGFLSWLTTTDHKKIGLLYVGFSLLMGIIGGGIAGMMRTQLTMPNQELMKPVFYNQLVSEHGTVMIFLLAMPILTGFGNLLIPLLIGARDMAFPKLNALSFWLLVPAATLMLGSFFVEGGPTQAGWTGYTPLTTKQFSGGPGVDMWIFGIHLSSLSSILGAINFIVTILNLRAPGMKLIGMPLFVWTQLVTSSLILIALPVLSGALTMLLTDRLLGTGFFVPSKGGDPLLYQHLFWFFGHPEVYILILPAFGMVSHIIPAFSHKKLFGYRFMVAATLMIGFIGYLVWGHHMFAAGMPPWLQSLFSIMTMLIAIPTGIKIWNWIATMWGGTLEFTTPMKFCLGFIGMFVIGGMTGIMLANVPIDVQVHDSYFVVGHFHYVILGGTVLITLGAFYFWFPKFMGNQLSEKLGTWIFWLIFSGFNITFFPMHFLGIWGMPRRIYTYRPEFQGLNLLSTFGYIITLIGGVLLVYDIVRTLRKSPTAAPDPWNINDIQQTLEWTTTSPPPPYNFAQIPVIQ